MSKHPESVEYAKGLIKNGVIEEQIRKLLTISGMDPQEVEEIMTEAKGQTIQPAASGLPQENPVQQSPSTAPASTPPTTDDTVAHKQPASPMRNYMPPLSAPPVQKTGPR